jgi:hypothetical protein
LALSAPAILYFVFAAFPATAFLQEVLIDASYVLIGFLLAGLAWLVWQLIAAVRALRPALAHALGENPARTTFRLLAEAAEGGGSSGDDGGRTNNRDDFPDDDFDGTGMDMDEVAELTYRHTGAGDMHIGGSAPRPNLAEIRDVLQRGTRTDLWPEQNAAQYVKDGIRVVVNRDLPWRSTANYIGG